MSLKEPLESPNIPVLNAKIEALQMVLEEKDKSIERLENDLTKAGQREEDLKQLHNNYFLQVQTLINQKAIGSPNEAIRKKQEVSGSNQEDNRKFQISYIRSAESGCSKSLNLPISDTCPFWVKPAIIL